MHPAQVVAGPVLAQDHVVVAGQRQGAGTALALAAPLAAQPHVRQGLDLGDDGEDVGGGEGTVHLAHPERVGQPQLERPERVAAAQVGADPVGDLAVAARLDPVQHEARARPEHVRDLVLQEQQPGGHPGDVVDPQVDPGLLAGHRATRAQPAAAGHPVAGVGDHQRGGQRQRGEQHADAQQRVLVEQVGAADRGDAGGEEGAPPGGEAAQPGPQS